MGGINLDQDFFQMSKLSEDQKKKSSPEMEHFLPRFQVKTKKKKVFTKNGTLFLNTDLRSDAHQSQIIGGDADEDHTQIVGGIQSNYWGDKSPPCFGTTALLGSVSVADPENFGGGDFKHKTSKIRMSSPKLRVIFRPKSEIQTFFSPKIRWSPKKKKKRSSPKLRVIFRPDSLRLGWWGGMHPPHPPPKSATALYMLLCETVMRQKSTEKFTN